MKRRGIIGRPPRRQQGRRKASATEKSSVLFIPLDERSRSFFAFTTRPFRANSRQDVLHAMAIFDDYLSPKSVTL